MDLIVMGQIPGTDKQLTFYTIVLFTLISVFVLILGRILVRLLFEKSGTV